MTIIDLGNILSAKLDAIIANQRAAAQSIQDLQGVVGEILKAVTEPNPPAGFEITLKGATPMAANKALKPKATIDFQLNDDGSATGTLTTVDTDQNPIPFPAGATIPAWTSSNAGLTVAASADGQSAVVTPTGVLLTDAVITVTSTLADGVTVLTGSSEGIDVVADAAKPSGFTVSLA
jgi:hypothetical protein